MSAFLGLPSGRIGAPDAPNGPPSPDHGGQSSQLRPHRRRRPATELLNPLVIPDDQPCPENKTMVQGFEWYVPADFQHWRRLTKIVPALAALGVTNMWIPPACKASWKTGNGYDIYDLYDLGEFEQKGSRSTKWGSKEELSELVNVANRHGVGIIFDAVLNHKAAADYSERVVATKVDPKDRTRPLGGEGAAAGYLEHRHRHDGGYGGYTPTPPPPPPREEEIEAWTGYSFPGRGQVHSPLRWNHTHFTGIDYDDRTKQNAVWKFRGKEWAVDVDEELGNYDYL